ncbi:MAG: C-glycoside deglycosidase beta subunit domain-containing protein [Saccharofermentanales bacterium]|jgi:hypothetical protein|nr:hypothetical protein [Clostridiaceae bacterium]
MKKSVQERLEIVDQVIGSRLLMTKPLKADSLRNRVFGDSCTGYSFQIDNLSYRGIWVSTIEAIELKVDGEAVAQEDMLFCIRDLKIPLVALGGHSEIFWGSRDEARISVNRVGGLKPGAHHFEILIKKRADFGHSYGEGEQGYEDATEFHTPLEIRDQTTYVIKEA